ncbi:LacI family transcriptional regulator [Algoriphagus ratkowskyi]|uniref:LacI family transcriptional regulator n=1 Tax=Algoriphagus ratkowskyi TaxID=57028 RepID=A0A2W7QPJ6_9BACT|nr:LacI family DNA-binding transcriptional regulator [Algoriphagus ratkowskyi]PZX50443.1 LacI family transcriptional regulator [Algoriphagus ratkowskyi]TXD75744.1 LacI family transcriptional regulator [Algoriphagus ratkowskyi]
MKRITVKDLAKHLLLSTSTVSRALLNDKNIHWETKKKVLAAAKELGYKRNSAAASLKYGQSKNIGFVVPEMVTPFSSKVLRGVQEVLYPLGYRVIVTVCDEDPQRERENLLLLEEFNVDGIIINLCDESKNHDIYQQLIDQGIPLVFFDRTPNESLNVSKVLIDNFFYASDMMEHLVDQGRKKIVHIMGPPSLRNSQDRAKGYEEVMDKHGIYDPALIIEVEGLGFEDGKKAIKTLMDQKIDFDGIFAFTDTLAIGAMNYLLENGVKIPNEVSMGSFSGTELATMVYPQLSSVEPPLEQMGEEAARLILEKIKNSDIDCRDIFLKAELKIRSSSSL